MSQKKKAGTGGKPKTGSVNKAKSKVQAPKPANPKASDSKPAVPKTSDPKPAAPEAPRPRSIAGQIVEYTPDPEEERKKGDDDLLYEDKLELATMSRRERRAVKKKRRDKEMEGMNRLERIKYLFFYYQWPILLTVLLVSFFGWIIYSVIKSSPPVALSAAVLNAGGDTMINEDIFSTYMSEANINSAYRIRVENYHLEPDAETGEVNPNHVYDENFTIFLAKTRESYFDIAITDRGGLNYITETECISHPYYVLPTDLLDALAPYEVTAKDSEKQAVVCGYDISGTDFAKSLDLGYTEIFISFPGNNSESQMHAENFVRYIFNLSRKEQ